MLTSVEYYKDERGRRPVLEFLLELQRVERAKCLSHVNLLKKYGYELKRPVAAYLRDGIHELRPKGNRVFYFFFHRDIVVLVHAIKKRTDAVPLRDVELSVRRKVEYEKTHK